MYYSFFPLFFDPQKIQYKSPDVNIHCPMNELIRFPACILFAARFYIYVVHQTYFLFQPLGPLSLFLSLLDFPFLEYGSLITATMTKIIRAFLFPFFPFFRFPGLEMYVCMIRLCVCGWLAGMFDDTDRGNFIHIRIHDLRYFVEVFLFFF